MKTWKSFNTQLKHLGENNMSKQIYDFELNEINASTYMLTCCSSCKNLVPYGNYCVACGSLMQKDMRTLEIITCPNCKKSTPIKGNYCVACGKPIHEVN